MKSREGNSWEPNQVEADGTKYDTWKEQSPHPDIKKHDLYEDRYKMYVICGQKDELKTTIKDNLKDFIKRDLTWFQLIGLVFNIIILVIFLLIFERRLQNRVTKPIQQLTKSIKNPKEFFSNKHNKGKKTKKKKEKESTERLDTDEAIDVGDVENDGIDGAKKAEQVDENKAIDEVQALEGIFYTFFGNQDSHQKNVLVEMSRHEFSLNPFHVLKPIVREGEVEDVDVDRFTFLPSIKSPMSAKKKKEFLDNISEEGHIVSPNAIDV